MNKRIIILTGIVAILLIVLFARQGRVDEKPIVNENVNENSGIVATSTPSTPSTPATSTKPTMPGRTSLSGEYLCLPHRNTSGPQTLECAFGLRTDDGAYYALDFNLMSQSDWQDIRMGERISANGVFTPVELLSTMQGKIYPIVGVFSVTDSLRLSP